MRAVAILHIPDSPFGAVRMGYADLARALAARGGTLDVITPERFRLTARLGARWWVLLVPFAAALWLWRRRRDYDVALFHSYAGWLFNLLPAGVPTVTQFHGLEPLFYAVLQAEHHARGRHLSPQLRFVHGWLMPRLLRATCGRSRLVTCLNRTEQQYLLDHHWVSADRLVVLRQAVPASFFVDHRDYTRPATRIAVVSQWLDTKGVRFLADAFSTLARERADVQLWCYGTGAPAAVVLESFPADVRGRVKVVDEIRRDDLVSVYRDADLFVHGSLSEGSSKAVSEAMASALPMVLTPVGAVPELLEDGRDCLIVPVRDSARLAQAIARVMDDVALRSRIGAGARRAAEAFWPDRCEVEYANLIGRLTAEDRHTF